MGKTIKVNTYYYKQFDFRPEWNKPYESLGGWSHAELPLDLDHTALVVMHAWDFGPQAKNPGVYRYIEYIHKSREIVKQIFPSILNAFRANNITIFHIVANNPSYYTSRAGFTITRQVSKKAPETYERIKMDDPTYAKLQNFRNTRTKGEHNLRDIENTFRTIQFAQSAVPRDNEPIAENRTQLFDLCVHFKINHLVYIGFALDWCLLFADGGMLDMKKHGLICSTIKDAVTAVENKATAENETCKAIGLWRVSLEFGYIYESKNLIEAMRNAKLKADDNGGKNGIHTKSDP